MSWVEDYDWGAQIERDKRHPDPTTETPTDSVPTAPCGPDGWVSSTATLRDGGGEYEPSQLPHRGDR